MNKVKMFFIAAALVLTTAGVFAGKAKFATFAVFADNGLGNIYQISSSTSSFIDLSNSGSVQATITGTAGTSYGLYTTNPGTATTKVYAAGGF